MTPIANTSVRRSATPDTCSGDMYPVLPLRMPLAVRSEPFDFAMPKSTIFAWPEYVTNTFCGLTSRWMMPSGVPSNSVSSWA